MDNVMLPEVIFKPSEEGLAVYDGQPLTPGKYICWPATTRVNHIAKEMGIADPVESEGMWIVDVAIETWGEGNHAAEYLCYFNPKTKKMHVIDGCAHKFYGPIPGTGEENEKSSQH